MLWTASGPHEVFANRAGDLGLAVEAQAGFAAPAAHVVAVLAEVLLFTCRTAEKVSLPLRVLL